MSEDYATVLAELEVFIREEGREDQMTETVLKFTRQSPGSMEQFIRKHMQ